MLPKWDAVKQVIGSAKKAFLILRGDRPDLTYARRLRLMTNGRGESLLPTRRSFLCIDHACCNGYWDMMWDFPLHIMFSPDTLEGWWDTISRHASEKSVLVILDDSDDTLYMGRVLALATMKEIEWTSNARRTRKGNAELSNFQCSDHTVKPDVQTMFSLLVGSAATRIE